LNRLETIVGRRKGEIALIVKAAVEVGPAPTPR
jgi:hypothetical protein